jgi:hypothetical protein
VDARIEADSLEDYGWQMVAASPSTSRLYRWAPPPALLVSLVVLGSATAWAEEGWRVVVGVASALVIVEALLAFVSGSRLRRAFSIVRVFTTAAILCASILRIHVASDRGASPSLLLVIPAVVAVAAVVIVEWRAWRQSENDGRLAIAFLTQAVVVAASAVAVVANLEMPL